MCRDAEACASNPREDCRALRREGASRLAIRWGTWTTLVSLCAFVVLSSCGPLERIDGLPGPIVIRSGGTYSGHWQSDRPGVPAVSIRTREPVVIENATIRSAGPLIHSDHGRYVHLTIRNVRGEAIPPTTAGQYPGRFLHADTYEFIRVENSIMIGTSGIYLHASRPGATVQIVGNQARNIDGRRSDGSGGYHGFFRVQFVQFDKGNELADSEVAWNEVINEPYESRVEDVVSLYMTSGRRNDPVRVHNNFIRGAFPEDPARDEYSGGGIMLADAGGEHLVASDNHVVATANYGIAISGGRSNRIVDNRVVSCGVLADGTPIASQNVGIYIWNLRRDGGFGENLGMGNVIAWAHPERGRNDAWVPDATVWEGNADLFASADRAVPCEAEDAEYDRWLQKVANAEVTVGPTVDLEGGAEEDAAVSER